MRRGRAYLSDAALLLATIAVCVVVLELGFRAYSGKALFDVTDWRSRRILTVEAAPHVEYDPLLGWKHREYYSSPGFNSSQFGIRKNHPGDRLVRTGGILVVGDSFTAGSDAVDAETWPAQLEEITGIPALNAAVGAYGIDQMVLRIETLLPTIHPKVIVIGTNQGIEVVGYSSFAWSKPYFTIRDDGRLVIHNSPVPPPGRDRRKVGIIKHALGYSYLADQLMTKYEPQYWFSADDRQWTTVPIDRVAVSCALLRRLKADAVASNARVIMVMQHGGDANLGEEPPEHLSVVDCANKMGIKVADEYEAIHAIAKKPDEFNSLYFRANNSASYGHMTAKGNRLVAELVAAALRDDSPGHSADAGR